MTNDEAIRALQDLKDLLPDRSAETGGILKEALEMACQALEFTSGRIIPWVYDKVCEGGNDGMFVKIGPYTFVDLGLPSGKRWATENADGYFTHLEAAEKFRNNLPGKEDFDELKKVCQWKWDDGRKGMVVTGLNGNSIFLPASGYRHGVYLYRVGTVGNYWSLSLYESEPNNAYGLNFSETGVGMDYVDRCDGQSVRLVIS